MATSDMVELQGAVLTYALLSHDAAIDPRYSTSLSPQEGINLNILLGTMLAKCGHHPFFHAMFSEAKKLAESASLSSAHTRIELAHQSAMSRYKYLHEKDSLEERPTPVQEPSDKLLNSGSIRTQMGTDKDQFMFLWDQGLQKRRIDKHDDAMIAFGTAFEMLGQDSEANLLTHLERGRFFLDLAGAMTAKGEQDHDEETLAKAIGILGFAEQESQETHDWRTHARASLDLSRRLFEWNDEPENIDRARMYAELAQESASRIHDKELSERVEHQISTIKRVALD